MATISNNEIARSIYLGAKDKQGHALSPYLKDVVKFLVRRRLLAKSEEILLSLSKIINQEEDRVTAKITSVKSLENKTKEDLIHLLKKRYSAKDVTLEEELDAGLLGGIKVEVNDEVIDLTIKNKIEQLQEYLIRNA